jgi:hypothetical protein
MRKIGMRALKDESGMALITTLLVMMLISALMAGTFAAVTADQRANMSGRDQTQVFAAAHAALEKLTADLWALFSHDVSPSTEAIAELTTRPPDFTPDDDHDDIEFREKDGDSGYAITLKDASEAKTIDLGPWEGFKGLVTTYEIDVTARGTFSGGAEVKLRRELQTVAIPAFQFGVFSETDQTFYAGDDFDFGGRVHTNGNLFLSEAYSGTLTFSDRITAVGDIVRANLSNGRLIGPVFFTGTVRMPTQLTPSVQYRSLASNEGSVTGMPGSTPTTPGSPPTSWGTWTKSTYGGNILNSSNGAKPLNLPLASQGAEPIDLIRRPVDSDEDDSNPAVFGQRFFATASLRILLSDRSEDITGLPTVTSTAPVQLNGVFGSYPTAASIGPISAVVGNSSTTTTIQLQGSFPAALRSPALTVGSNTNITCTTKTATVFSGCTALTTAVTTGTIVSATLPSNVVVSTTMASNASAGATSLTVNSTARFSPGLFWVNGTAVTCTGYDTTPQFTGCSGLSASPSSGQTISTHALVPVNTALIGGYIKIEKQSSTGVWSDVTAEILALGIGAANQDGGICADPTANAILRIQRLRDNAGSTCAYAGSTNPHDWWPNTLYDTREGNYRDITPTSTTTLRVGGVMHYVSLDVNNLKRWFAGSIGTTGAGAWNNNGYIVYFSDRRGDHNENDSDKETGEYGFEDVVNPASSTGAQNGQLDGGEDVNDNDSLDRYGESPWTVPTGSTAPYDANARPWTTITNAQARGNKQVLFRRALKLVNGGIVSGVNSLPASGLTVASENPVYVQGNYNATTSSTAEPNVPAAIIADAVSLLSNNFKDTRSFVYPNSATDRNATTTAYRFGVIAGKNRSFTYPTAGDPYFLFGTDGGAGNFLRLLEDWNISGVSINYRGSMISLYYSRQATGTFKYNANVYDYGVRNFTFDTDFLTPSLLPPGTPMFRDINVTSFRQILSTSE